jgi:Protein of unknown function (DUF1566)
VAHFGREIISGRTLSACITHASGPAREHQLETVSLVASAKKYPQKWSHVGSLMVLLSAIASCAAFAQKTVAPMNDTGQTRCVFQNSFISCKGTGQDGEFGRDAAFDDDADGHGGFSFVKLSSSGMELPAAATDWSCVRDKVTGLTWEVKTDDGGMHDGARIFTNVGDGSAEDTSRLAKDVNAEGLCGFSDWRVPSRLEVQSILNYERRLPLHVFEQRWFPHIRTNYLTTSTPNALNPSNTWWVSFDGRVVTYADYDYYPKKGVMLVRSDPADPPLRRFVPNGDEVTDTATGLIWKRCSEGQKWDGSTCIGEVKGYSLGRAMQIAHQKGWRVPNLKELSTLIDETKSSPAIDLKVFPSTPVQEYWSSTYGASYNQLNFAWRVNFWYGANAFHFHRGRVAVRLVRDPQ